MLDIRVGHGVDAHGIELLASEETMMLFGIPLLAPLRIIAHSDGDVGLHALTDALLGTIGDGDIGSHFPSHDPEWAGAASEKFLRHALELVRQKGGVINHVDATLIGEHPKMAPHRQKMRTEVADILEIELERVSIKATTTDKLGFLGRSEGIAAFATATVIFPS